MGDSTLSIRTLTYDDFPALSKVLAAAFQSEFKEENAERERRILEPDRTHGIFDGDEMIGVGGILTRDLTLPGAMPTPAAAVTAVGVKPGHRRRGVASLLMRTQLHGLHEENKEAIAILWASEGSIYGRFGYGIAAEVAMMSIPHQAPFRPEVKVDDRRIREVTRDEAMPVMRELHDRVRRARTGWLNRVEGSWLFHLGDEESDRDGLTSYRYALHPRGYTVYRVKHDWQTRGPRNELHVREIVAETDEAYAALYRHLLDMDLAGEVKYFTASDDPITHMIVNARTALRERTDSLWVRIADVERALPQRRYQSDVDYVLQLSDEFCPWNQGKWRFTTKSGEAVVQRTTDEPDVALDISVLGSVFLGGPRLSVFARAQRVRECTPGAVSALSAAFLDEREPHCPEVF
ncbi:UPF0256 protein [Lentzea sp. NBRC 105346]|uniref:GNAT family N-acetyltransferase n=1 Tax=Lentzea sp. NBRC 105346 TaxID=3032205 RepID=UPI0024A250B2|nr:GNAT family N-acetyltransferase [Lentzea sp. NBRC 105346]GLZ34920.1 UPF0256 protein [Lentzea sp. NBRC 105346]